MPLSLPDLCDAHPDEIHLVEPIFRDFGGRKRFFGEILTIGCFEDNSKLRDRVRTPGEGRVLVVDGAGSMRCALLGDLLAAAAVENGWSGIVINGCVRDVEILRDIDLGIRALNCVPVKSRKRGEGAEGDALRFGGVSFTTGDWLYADENGMVVTRERLPVDF
jgi:regulator of ribonuclease activity A